MNIIWIIVFILLYFYIVSCTFFTVQIAAVKGRRRAWGWLGFLLGILGFAIVCFLPNAKGVTGETNPIKTAFRKLSGVSPIAVWIMVAGVVVIVGGALLGTRLTTYFENRSHEKELSSAKSEAEYLTPSKVSGKVAGIFAGDGNNFAVTEAGDLYGWGQVGMTALDESGKVYENVKKIAAAGDTIYLLTADNTLYAKGNNKNSLIPGQEAEYVETFAKVEEDVKDIALSETVGAILKNSGNLYVVGINEYGQLGRATDRISDTESKMAGDVAKVEVTARSLYYMTTGGTVCGVGSNAYGQFGLGNEDAQGNPVKLMEGCSDFAAGEDFLLLLKAEGTVWSAGNDCYGQLGREIGELPEEAEEAPAEGEEAPAEGEEEEAYQPVPANVFGELPALAGATRVEAAGHSAFALIEKELYAWGHNHLGQLGNQSGNRELPTVVSREAVDISAGGNCTLILTEDGELKGAGDTRSYQLGARHNGKGFDEIAEVKADA